MKHLMPHRIWLGLRQPLERGAQFCFHRGGIKVAADADDQLAAKTAVMPSLQIRNRDSPNRCQLRLPRIWAVGSVHQLRRFAPGNLAFLVIAAHDAGRFLLLREP